MIPKNCKTQNDDSNEIGKSTVQSLDQSFDVYLLYAAVGCSLLSESWS